MNVNEKGFNLYWENYHRAFEWQNNSRVSHWKARASALEMENALLRDFIQRELHTSLSHSIVPPAFDSGINTGLSEEKSDDIVDEKASLHCDVDIDEELLAFYEKTIQHKIDRKKKQSMDRLRDSDDSQSENEKIYSMGPLSTAQKSKDMALLYGDDAPKILSMELSMQINFDMNCNKSNAQLWPNIPLRLS